MVFASSKEREDFIVNNLPLIKLTIKTYFIPTAKYYDDMYSAGCIGLIKAADFFEPDKGVFSTYAMIKIRREIQEIFRTKRAKKRVPDSEITSLDMAYGLSDSPLIEAVGNDYDVYQEVEDKIIISKFIEFINEYKSPEREVMIELHDLDDLNRLGRDKYYSEVARTLNSDYRTISTIDKALIQEFKQKVLKI